MSEQIIVSYPKEKLSRPLWKSYSYFVSFPTMWQRNEFLFETFFCSFPYFVIELKPARLTLLSTLEFPSTEKFMMLGLLTFTIFFDENIFSGYILRKEFNLFSKMVQATSCPFSVSPSSVTRKMVPLNPALFLFCQGMHQCNLWFDVIFMLEYNEVIALWLAFIPLQ